MPEKRSIALLTVGVGAVSAVVLVSALAYRRARKSKHNLAQPFLFECCGGDKNCCEAKSDSTRSVEQTSSTPSSEKPIDNEDLEDVFEGLHGSRYSGRDMHGMVLPRIATLAGSEARGLESLKSDVPGTQLVYVKTFGCSHNGSDSEVMMGLLQSYGYRFTDTLEDSDICLVNSCTVKNPSQEAFMTLVRKAKKLRKALIVAGCVPQADRHLAGLEDVSIIGTSQIHRVVEVVEQAIQGNVVRLLAKAELPSLDIPKVRRNKLIEIIPVSTGCLGACTYCKTKQARGHLGSYTVDAILHRIRTSVREGVQQIWLTSEDTGAYGLDIGTHIGNLMEACASLLASIEEETGTRVMLRLGMTNPPYMAAHIDQIASVLCHRNVFQFIHIPVQSGSNKVLKDMVREYTIEDFNKLVETLRERVPNMTIATDIICGFPTERNSDHIETVGLIQKYEFQIVNISQFYPRPGTPAAKMKRIPTQIVKARSSEVSKCFRSYSKNDFLLNSFQRVWFSDHQSDKGQSVGHTVHFIKVIVPEDLSLFGTIRWVKISKTKKWHSEGYVCPPPLPVYNTTDELYPKNKLYPLH